MKRIDLNLSKIAGGGIQENVDLELNKVFENIHDINTKAETKRKMTITLEFAPDENRELVAISSQIKTTLAPLNSVLVNVMTGKENGKIEARELKSGAVGQMYFDVEDEVLKTDIGVPVSEVERTNKVIDLQSKAN